MNDWDATVTRFRRRWGSELDLSAIADRFLPFFHGPRIRVDLGGYKPLTGRVGIATGWRPTLLLMLRSDSVGSPWTLSDTHDLLGVQIGGIYRPPADPQVVSLYARWAATHGGIR